MLRCDIIVRYLNINFNLDNFYWHLEADFAFILYLCNRIRFSFLENFSELKNKKVSQKVNLEDRSNNKT